MNDLFQLHAPLLEGRPDDEANHRGEQLASDVDRCSLCLRIRGDREARLVGQVEEVCDFMCR